VGNIFSDVTSDECTRQTRRVTNVQIHEAYTKALENDIALVTTEPFQFNEFVQPACLPEAQEFQQARVSWGVGGSMVPLILVTYTETSV
jgi:cob(I)alamin adenosyltransferase